MGLSLFLCAAKKIQGLASVSAAIFKYRTSLFFLPSVRTSDLKNSKYKDLKFSIKVITLFLHTGNKKNVQAYVPRTMQIA
jgi:hypothetical protein